MNQRDHWLERLPPESPESQLLRAGRDASPPEGSLEASWQALAVTLGASAAAVTVSAQAAASSAVAAKLSGAVGTSLGAGAGAPVAVASATASGSLAVGAALVAKPLAVGFVVGLGLLGAQTAVERATRPEPVTAPIAAKASAASARGTPRPARAPRELAFTADAVSSASKEDPLPPSVARAVVAPSKLEKAAASPKLSEHAAELAQIQRLLDASDANEARRRLELDYARHAAAPLAEERDALYIEALKRSGQGDIARARAELFLQRFPTSPHVGKMRALVATE